MSLNFLLWQRYRNRYCRLGLHQWRLLLSSLLIQCLSRRRLLYNRIWILKQLLIEHLTWVLHHQVVINRCWNSTVILLLVAVRVLGIRLVGLLIGVMGRCPSPNLDFLELLLLTNMWFSNRISRWCVVFWLHIFPLRRLWSRLLLMKIGVPSIIWIIDIFSANWGHQILGRLVRIFTGPSSCTIARYFPATTHYRVVYGVLRAMHHHEGVLNFSLQLRLPLELLIILMM